MSQWLSEIKPTWCPGCGDYVILGALKTVLEKLKLNQDKTVIVYDIGCIGNMADFIKAWGFHALHGRSIPTAVGIKNANPKLKVIVVGGDGGIYGEGLGHMIAAARLNLDMTVLVANNQLYSLTTGQSSPTTPKGVKTKSTPKGVESVPVLPMELIKMVNPEALAQRVDGSQPQAVMKAIKVAIKHQGFDLLDINQLCISFGKQLRRQ
jgi:2-oxoglutarate ferredoxin oxidoreductase subunit beta